MKVHVKKDFGDELLSHLWKERGVFCRALSRGILDGEMAKFTKGLQGWTKQDQLSVDCIKMLNNATEVGHWFALKHKGFCQNTCKNKHQGEVMVKGLWYAALKYLLSVGGTT